MNILDLLFPIDCLGCGRNGCYICRHCIERVSTPKPVCPECLKASIDGMTHVRCTKKHSLDSLYSVWTYQGVVRKAIIKLKYKYLKEIALELADYANKEIIKNKLMLPQMAVLVPVPMYWYKENYRGFNQTKELGKIIAKNLGWEYRPDLLLRKRMSAPQVELKGRERRKNTTNVFALNPNYSPSRRLSRAGGKLLSTAYVIFDDVYTTGSTMKEACKVMKRNGANKVWGLTIAR